MNGGTSILGPRMERYWTEGPGAEYLQRRNVSGNGKSWYERSGPGKVIELPRTSFNADVRNIMIYSPTWWNFRTEKIASEEKKQFTTLAPGSMVPVCYECMVPVVKPHYSPMSGCLGTFH